MLHKIQHVFPLLWQLLIISSICKCEVDPNSRKIQWRVSLLSWKVLTYTKLILRNKQSFWWSNENFSSYLHFTKAIVRHFVHEAVEQSWWTRLIHSELSLRSEVVALLKKTQRRAQKNHQMAKVGSIRSRKFTLDGCSGERTHLNDSKGEKTALKQLK